MTSAIEFLQAAVRGFPDLPPRVAFQRLVYWGVILLMSLVIGFTTLSADTAFLLVSSAA